MKRLTLSTLEAGSRILAERDPDLGRILGRLGPPPMWRRPAGFPTLIHIILEQQVSLASARAAMKRLLAMAGPLTPASFLAQDEALLKAVGFSRQKIVYGRDLATRIQSGSLNLTRLATLDDGDARTELTKVKGIGSWSADIYLLMALRRPDIWPAGDLALASAAWKVKRMPSRPSTEELEILAESWRPWRAIAARMLWHHYLSGPR